MRAVDLFAGWGGMTQGAADAGVEVVWAANHWPLAVEAHAANHPSTTHVCQDLRQADWTALPAFDLLLAAPSCQGHSTASQPRRRPHHDALRATAFAVLDCASVTRPAAVLVENVPAFRRWELFDWYLQGFALLGYRVEQRLVTASHHGVPQRRRRLLLLATRDGRRVGPLPGRSDDEPAFGPCLQPGAPTRWRPVADAPAGMRRRIQRGRRNHGRRFLTQSVTGHPGVPLHEPIRTITGAANHWNLVDGHRYRPLAPRELARGMGFADSYRLPSGATARQVTLGLGNAVPPPLAAAAVTALADAAA